MSQDRADRRWAVSLVFLVPLFHPLLIPLVGVPSHLLWFVHVLPVAWWTFHRGRMAAIVSISMCLGAVVVGERAFGAGYFVPADWQTTLALAIALGFTCVLVAAFALYARRANELQRQLWQAQKLESLGLFAGGVAHDFNNVLTAITVSSEMALEDLPQNHVVREHVTEVRNAADRASLLVKRLMAFARRDAVRAQSLNANVIVEGLEVLLRRIVNRKVDLVLRLYDTATVRADHSHLEQIITNLVVNASDAMPDGGLVTIITGTVPREHPSIPAHVPAESAQYAVISVADTGVGMDAATQARIFEPLFTTKPVGKGTGLGLSTVRGLAAEWGGFVTVESAPRSGTTFRVFLPVAAEGVTVPRDGAPGRTSLPVRV